MAASSALSTLTRTPTPSPPSIYHTVDEGASSRGGDVTDMSSPGEAGGEEDFSVKTPYRDALSLPRELKLRCQIHLEEQYYAAALNLLNSLLCDGISHANASTKPAHVPPPGQLAVLATLAIHPKHTSKLASLDAHDTSSMSLSYLRNVLATVGPVNAKLRNAFVYRGDNGRRRRSSNDFHTNGSESDEDYIRGKTANGGSIWARGQDFWKVLGWAFNCSALYPHRWRWWKPWLEFMLDVLEEDYEERKRLDQEREGKEICDEYRMLKESLLVAYIAPKNSRSAPVRPIMSALFADGSASSASIYSEVFNKETKIASKTEKKRKRNRIDLENDEFGDYNDDSSTGGSEPPTPEHQRTSAKKADDSVSWTDSALAETVPLRLRIFSLLSRAGDEIPDKCRFKISNLYEIFIEKIVQLPVPAFSRFIAAHNSPLALGSLVTVIRNLLPALLPSTAPRTDKVDPEADENEVSVVILEQCYLPFAYRTAENNAKLSLAIESLFRIMWTAKCIQWSPSLHQAVVKGIKARNDKSAPRKGSRKENGGEQAARDTLRASGNRLLALCELLKMVSPDDA